MDDVATHELTPGLYPNIPASAYHRRTLGVVSKSALDRLRRTPAHYKCWVDGDEAPKDSPALDFGRAFHCALLEPEVFAMSYAVEPEFGDCRKSDNKKARDAWRGEHLGAEMLTAEDDATIREMVASVQRHPLAGKMIVDGRSELTLLWKDEETGLSCKSRSDYYVEKLGMVADVKSTEDASRESFARDIVRYRYHWQDALYRAGYGAIGAAVRYFMFVAVEKSPPYAVATHTLDANGIGRGYTHVRRQMTTMAECLTKNVWPAYPVSIETIELPPWA